jgi:hypothetical protein
LRGFPEGIGTIEMLCIYRSKAAAFKRHPSLSQSASFLQRERDASPFRHPMKLAQNGINRRETKP